MIFYYPNTQKREEEKVFGKKIFEMQEKLFAYRNDKLRYAATGGKKETSISGWLTGQVPKTRVFWSPLFIELFSAKKPGSFWSKSGLKL